MTLKETIESNLKAAMKAGKDDQKRVLRLILAAVKLAEVEKGSSMDDSGLLSIVQKEVKIRREAIEGAQTAHRDDLVAAAQREILILEELLPKQLSDADLFSLVEAAATEVGATTLNDTGKVMKAVMPKVQGRAAGDKVSQVVRQVLQSRQ
jgi:uncharacterized protein YqeY